MAQQNFNGMDVATRDNIKDDLINTFNDPNFAPVFHQKIKEVLDGRRHVQGLPPYDNNHFQAALNAFLIDQNIFPNLQNIFPNLILNFPPNVVATEGDAEAVQPAPAMGGRRKRATRKRATKRRGRKQRKTKKHPKRK